MKLIRVQVENFKLLGDVRLDFSTDRQKPLTVIRAENGSGKTSLLYALLWGLYGAAGLPSDARALRLTSSACPADTPIEVKVSMEFEHTDTTGKVRYLLIRSVKETPTVGDQVKRAADKVDLYRMTDGGHQQVTSPQAVIEKLAPERLKDVFFTNGDDVQTFISGRVAAQQRQGRVHDAIKTLLGLDVLRQAECDIEDTFKALRRQAAQSGGQDVEAAEQAVADTDAALLLKRLEVDRLNAQMANMTLQEEEWEKQLNNIRHLGDLEQLNIAIARTRDEINKAATRRSTSVGRARQVIKSEDLSWALLKDRLESGLAALDGLASKGVIPGTSLGVLQDRLELERCICGESLHVGDHGAEHRRAAIEQLLEQQREVTDNEERLSDLLYRARFSRETYMARIEAGDGFLDQHEQVKSEFVASRDEIRDKNAELKSLEERRSKINDEEVQTLSGRIGNVRGRMMEVSGLLAVLGAEIATLMSQREEQIREKNNLENSAKMNESATLKRDVADDLLRLVRGMLNTLETDYVLRLSERMSARFLEIVGARPDLYGQVFTGVTINEKFDIVVSTQNNRSLDNDFELNGASQRALTMSFIWALTEVSGVGAPRIIDTPLGMVAGGVKSRLVESITSAPSEGDPDFQVILLLTRSEVRDIEGILDSRSGAIHTMSCSKDYPADLRYEWPGIDRPLVRVCSCTHRQSCRTCARHYDDVHGIEFRNTEES